jgi:hypothetical protein
MGYTHYWLYDPMDIKFVDYLSTMKIIRQFVEAHEDEYELEDYKYKEDRSVFFNGKSGPNGENGETFWFPGETTGPMGTWWMDSALRFSFCKTSRRSYDDIIVGALCIIGHYLPCIEISSDGDPEDWKKGFMLAQDFIKTLDPDLVLKWSLRKSETREMEVKVLTKSPFVT